MREAPRQSPIGPITQASSAPEKTMKLYRLPPCLDRSQPFYWLAQGGLTGLFVHRIFLEPASVLFGLYVSGLLLPVHVQARDFDFRCQRSTLNSPCRANQLSEQPPDVAPESQRTPTPSAVIKFRLNNLSGVAEWIRAEVTGNQVKLLHTVVAESGLSQGLTSIINAPIAIGHTWYDHPTSRIAFQPDGCERSDCIITGTDAIALPIGTDIYQGRFTLEYTESGWLRTITFKLPDQKKSSPPIQSSSDKSSREQLFRFLSDRPLDNSQSSRLL
jgi:hypothetical protein